MVRSSCQSKSSFRNSSGKKPDGFVRVTNLCLGFLPKLDPLRTPVLSVFLVPMQRSGVLCRLKDYCYV